MADNEATGDAIFSLEKIYVKDISFEAPTTPHIFMEAQPPEVHVELGVQHRPLNPQEALYEVVLGVNATARRGDKNFFLVEAQQAGVFRVAGIDGEALTKTLEISCAHVLLPFVREVINALVVKGGFPPLLINPMNFEAMYEHKRVAMQSAPAPAAPAPH